MSELKRKPYLKMKIHVTDRLNEDFMGYERA